MMETSERRPGKEWYLDDITVGQRFEAGSYALEEANIRAFAKEFDPQPFHTDPEAAKATFFGGLVASGWHTAAITMRLLVQSGLPLAGGIIGAGGSIKWPRPARPGDILRVEGKVLEVTPSRSRPDRGTVLITADTVNQQDEIVQIMQATLVVPRRT